MRNPNQEKYKGYRLIGVPEDEAVGLKAVDSDGDLGVLLSIKSVRSPVKDDPSRTVYYTIKWQRKGVITNYHFHLGWVVVGESSAMALRPSPRYESLLDQSPRAVAPKSWFARLCERLGL